MLKPASRPTPSSVRRASLAVLSALTLTACASAPPLSSSAARGASASAAAANKLDAFLGAAFDAADADHDGRLTSAEIGLDAAQFQAFDRDKDRVISRAEWERGATVSELRGALGAYRPMVTALQTRLDADGNHAVSRQELQAVVGDGNARAGLTDWEITMAWTLADANSDGVLNDKEFETFYLSLGADMDAHGGKSRAARGLLGAYLSLVSHIAVKEAVYPSRNPPTGTPKDAGLAYEDVTLRSADGTPIAAWYVPNAKAGTRAVVMVHGKGDSRQMGLRQNTLKLLAGRYTVMTIDLRNHGRSGGTATSYGQKEGEDVAAAVAELKRRGHTDVALYGVSLGGASVIRAAALDRTIRGVVDDCAYSTVLGAFTGFIARLKVPAAPLVAAATLARANADLGFDISKAQPREQMAAIAPRPLLILHGEKDPAVSVAQARENFEAAGPNPAKALWIVPGAGHADSATTAPEEYGVRVLGLFEKAFAR